MNKKFITAWLYHISFVLTSILLSNLFDFYFVAHVHFIKRCSILIQNKLKAMTNTGDEEHFNLLKILKNETNEILHLSLMVNRRFAHSLLASITSKLVLLVIDLYWIYLRIVNSNFNEQFLRTKNTFSFVQP